MNVPPITLRLVIGLVALVLTVVGWSTDRLDALVAIILGLLSVGIML